MRDYLQHARRHSPRGTDATPTDDWMVVAGGPATAWNGATAYSVGDQVGDGGLNWICCKAHTNIEPGVGTNWPLYWTVTAPYFQNGDNADPDSFRPDPVPLQFRLSVGPPNIIDATGAIAQYTNHQIEIQGDLQGLHTDDVVFLMPLEYRHDHDVPYSTHDDLGGYIPCRLLSTGEFIWNRI